MWRHKNRQNFLALLWGKVPSQIWVSFVQLGLLTYLLPPPTQYFEVVCRKNGDEGMTILCGLVKFVVLCGGHSNFNEKQNQWVIKGYYGPGFSAHSFTIGPFCKSVCFPHPWACETILTSSLEKVLWNNRLSHLHLVISAHFCSLSECTIGAALVLITECISGWFLPAQRAGCL